MSGEARDDEAVGLAGLGEQEGEIEGPNLHLQVRFKVSLRDG